MVAKKILEAPREQATARKSDPAVVAAVAKLSAAPPVAAPSERTPIAKVTYSLPYELREWARDLAFRARISESAIVETALGELRALGGNEAIARVKASGGGLRRK